MAESVRPEDEVGPTAPSHRVAPQSETTDYLPDTLSPPVGGPEPKTLVCQQFRQHWEQGRRVAVEDYLQRHQPFDEEAILDLIYCEFVLREDRGEKPQADEYLRRFPQLAPRLQRLFDLDRGMMNWPTQLDEPRPDPSLPQNIGKYQVIRAFDESGQGSVYHALHPTLGAEVVIKLGNDSMHSGQRQRLLEEGRILSDLNHPSLARVHDLDFHDDRPFLVLEYIRGRNLEQFAKQERPSPAQAATLVAQIARAVAVAHRQGIIHRDLKPRNIVVDEKGLPRVIDFGLAQMKNAWTDAPDGRGTICGTVQFMAPEQARGETARIDQRTDVFALGGILYFLLTGKDPYSGKDLPEVLARAAACQWDREALAARRIPRRLQDICAQALAENPAQRPTSADVLAHDLEAFIRKPRLIRLAALAAGIVTLLLLGLGWSQGWWSSSLDPDPERGRSHPVPRKPLQPGGGPTLLVEVWDEDDYRELANVMPLHTGAKLKLLAEAPADMHVSLFLFNSEGKAKLLTRWTPNSPLPHRYPAEGKAVVLSGPPGTELLLVCGRRSGPIEDTDMQKLWPAPGDWFTLPGKAVLRLQHDRISRETKDRDLGAIVDSPDPVGRAQQRLESLRQQLCDHFEYFEGLAFAHKS